MKTLTLTKGKFTTIDDDAPAWIFKVKWYAVRIGRRFYAVRTARCIDGKRRQQYLHRAITRASLAFDVDHIDGNGLNNQGANLKVCSHAENMRGRVRKKLSSVSEYRGVGWNRALGKWDAQIKHSYRRIYIGYFEEEIEAARAFDAKARELGWPEHGLNFPSDDRKGAKHVSSK